MFPFFTRLAFFVRRNYKGYNEDYYNKGSTTQMKSFYVTVKYNGYWNHIYKVLDFIVDACR